MLLKKHAFFILFSCIFTIHATFDLSQLLESIETINTDVDHLRSAIDKFDGILNGIAIVKAVAKLKDDMGMATKEANKGKPDHFPWEDSLNITLQMQELSEKVVGALGDLVAKEPRTRSSGVRHHVPYQLEYLKRAYTSLFDVLSGILDPPDLQDLHFSQGKVDIALDQARDAYGQRGLNESSTISVPSQTMPSLPHDTGTT